MPHKRVGSLWLISEAKIPIRNGPHLQPFETISTSACQLLKPHVLSKVSKKGHWGIEGDCICIVITNADNLMSMDAQVAYSRHWNLGMPRLVSRRCDFEVSTATPPPGEHCAEFSYREIRKLSRGWIIYIARCFPYFPL